ncbi:MULTISPECIES: PAS domain-containing protein [unclassified Pseudomonas]|uniref:PAS domain-containing protein n=1 Tax=unclassified Pseudomonas TaxID=196821 RepID=UPI00156E4D7D|nr:MULTISPECIES: PAS domain-containing protein [unclassified Pseudomonas]
MLYRLVKFFEGNRLYYNALGVLIAVGGGVAVGNYYRLQVEDVYLAGIEAQTHEHAAELEQWKSDGFAIGALSILGRHNPVLKRVIEERSPSLELMEQAAIPLSTLSIVVGASHAFVANLDGEIVAVHDLLNPSQLGLSVAFRPYFNTALKGVSSVYGAISTVTGTRMFYMAVPIYASRTRQDKVIGVLVARFDALLLDSRLSKHHNGDVKMILSSSGVVLAANAQPVLLKADREWSPGAFIGDIREQFADYPFPDGIPERLPFDAHQPVVTLEGRRYGLSRADFDWSDPGGPWSLITLGDLDSILPNEQILLIEGVSAGLFFLLWWGGLRRLADARRHKRDVALIEQSEQRLDLALQSGALGLWDWNVSLGIVINNCVWLRILGYSQCELECTFGNGLDRWARLIHSDDLESVMAKLNAHLDNQTDEYRAEYRVCNKNGDWLWVLDIGKVMQRDAQGVATRVTGVLQDITQTVEAQRAIVDNQSKLQSMISNIPGVVFRSLPNGGREMIFVSNVIEDLSGYPAQHFLSGRAYRELVHPDDLGIFDRCLDDGSYMLEYRIITATQEVRWVYDKGQTIDVDGLAQYLDGVIFDITERKAGEALVKQSRRDAELATQAKSMFLDNMSHEIRTPLNAIVGMSHLLLDMPLGEAQRRYIEKMDRAARNLVGIINGILDLSKIEAGKLSIEHVHFDLLELVEEVLNLVRQRAEEKGISLCLEIPSLMPRRYVGDPLRLSQVLTNLVDNSIKFTEVGHVCISVRQVRQWSDKVLLCFSVSDTGIGISEEQRIRLFDAFVQADPSITRRYGGTGLGLTISKKIVQMMQGNIWVDSREGRGAEFKFTVTLGVPQCQMFELPTLVKHELATQGADRSASVVTAPYTVNDFTRLLEGTRILVVEDHPMNQEVLEGLLQRVQVQVVVANNGEDALQLLLHNSHFDAILMDCQMPVMDGYRATVEIRRHLHLLSLPIIAVTANTLVDAKERMLAAGMNDHIAKPLEVNELYRTLARWINPPEVLAGEYQPLAPSVASELHYHGIDTAFGLSVVNHDVALYQKLLCSFRDSHHEFVAHLWRSHAIKDLQAVGFLAHGLRSAAGHIGARAVQRAAGRLEDHCGGDADLAPLIRQLAYQLQSVLASLADLQQRPVLRLAEEGEDECRRLMAKLECLAALLSDQNAQALRLVDELCEGGGCRALLAIQERVYRLEFQQAHDLLITLRASKALPVD